MISYLPRQLKDVLPRTLGCPRDILFFPWDSLGRPNVRLGPETGIPMGSPDDIIGIRMGFQRGRYRTFYTCPTDIPFLPTGCLQDIIGMSTGQPHERNFGGRKSRTEKLLSISILEFVHCRHVDVLGSSKFSNCLHPGLNLGPSDL